MRIIIIIGILLVGVLLIMTTCDRIQVKQKLSRELNETYEDASIVKWEDHEYGYLFDKECEYYLATIVSNTGRSEILVRAYKGHLIRYYTPAQTKKMLDKCHAWHLENR